MVSLEKTQLARAILPNFTDNILIAAQLVEKIMELRTRDDERARNIRNAAKFLLEEYKVTADSNLEHVLLVAHQVLQCSRVGRY